MKIFRWVGTTLLSIILCINFSACEEEVDVASILEAVDWGLSVKWATHNVGAIASEDYGDSFGHFFAFGCPNSY